MLVTTVSRTQAGNCMQVGTTRFVIAISFVYVRGLLFLELFRFPNVPVVVWGTNLASLQTEVESLPENYSIAIFSKCSRREYLSPTLS